MKHFVTIIGAFGFLTTVSVNAQVDAMKTADLSQPLSTENIEALRAFKQLGFDDQHTSGRIRQSDIAVHNVYHGSNQGSGNYKPYKVLQKSRNHQRQDGCSVKDIPAEN